MGSSVGVRSSRICQSDSATNRSGTAVASMPMLLIDRSNHRDREMLFQST